MDLDSPDAAPVDLGHRTFLAQTHGIVDPTQVAAAQFADLPVEPLNPPLLGRRLHNPPLLVALHALPWQTRLELLERADAQLRDRGRPLFCTLLESDAPDRVRPHLMSRMAPLRPRTGRVLFRVHDARVFRHLRWMLGPSQMAQLMGPIVAWTWHEPLGNTWRTQLRPATEGPPGALIDPDQWEQLAQVACINGCLKDLAEAGAGHASTLLPALLQALREAHSAGLHELDDLQWYACQRLRGTGDPAEQVVVSRRLERVHQQGMSYRMACQLELQHGLQTEAA